MAELENRVADVAASAAWSTRGVQARGRVGSALGSAVAGHVLAGAPRADNGGGRPAACEMCGSVRAGEM